MTTTHPAPAPIAAAIPHPLDPLSPDEIRAAARIIREARPPGDSTRFVTIELHEPSKEALAAPSANGAIPREAFAILLDRDSNTTHEAVVDLGAQTLRSWSERPGIQPYFLFEEFGDAVTITRNHAEWRAAAERRGADPDKVHLESQPAGLYDNPDEEGKRILRVIAYRQPKKDDAPWAQPIEGLVCLVDVQRREVVRLVDEESAPIPKGSGNYDLDAVGPVRTDLKPLDIVQPEGVSFTMNGYELAWQRWRMRVGFTPREGLVLYQIAYEDPAQGQEAAPRSVCYRASLGELVVPYGSTGPGQYWRNFFDSGEAGIGRFANSLELGCDCLGSITYLDAVWTNDQGEPVTVSNAICIHEEDFGVLWKHNDIFQDGNGSAVRRSRRLVISYFATVGNYDYGFYWYFYQDGSIEVEIKLTGVVLTQGVPDGAQPQTATLIDQNLSAPNHQHLFCFRLDLDVDGPVNTVHEIHSEPLPAGPENPHGNAFRSVATPLTSEQGAIRDADPACARYWKVVNPARTNAAGLPRGYALIPGETVAMMAAPDSSPSRRAGFARHQLWVTPNAEGERYPAGDYPNLHPGGDGLPRWTQADRPLENQDVVLWYTVGVNHIVRPEEWPVSPVHRAGFALKPWAFFDRNPALDVAPPNHCH